MNEKSFAYHPVTIISSTIVLWQCILTIAAVWLSTHDNWILWFIGQFLLGIAFIQWFFVLHELAHYAYFKNRMVNAALGHLASLFCLLPYYPWKYIHDSHHKWTGYNTPDPTVPDYGLADLSKNQLQFIDFCWRNWVPVFAISYVSQTFYNLKKLFKLYPSKMYKTAFSVLFIIIVYGGIITYLSFPYFLKIWGLAFIWFVSIADPMLLSQHTHLDRLEEDQEMRPVRFVEQPHYTRTLIYPKWIEKYVLYSSSKHGIHHQYPWVAGYQLPQELEVDNTIHWLHWLKIAKKIPGHSLIFESYQHTGVKL